MQINRLSLTHVRVFEQAEFGFQPGMNLIVGVNGSGKSTILDVLCIMLSKALPKLTASISQSLSFSDTDITVGRDMLNVELEFLAHGKPFESNLRREYGKDSFEIRPNRRDILGPLKKKPEQPLAVYFSVHRSLANIGTPGKSEVAEGQATAFVSSLTPHELRLRTLGYWWLKQEIFAKESETKLPKHHLEVLKEAVTLFLDNCSDFHVERAELPQKTDRDGKIITEKPKPELFINKGTTKLNVRYLSEGERGILALVLDLARRLSLANPRLENPLAEGKAIVLIDEIDLHLHPSWQRSIVGKLTRTFPKCQFIATTHSPQILGEVPAENIILLEHGQAPYHPLQSLGMDSNWILQFLMGDADRNKAVAQKLEDISDLIEEEHYDQAQGAIDALREQIGDFPDLVRLQTRLERLQILGV